MCYEHSSIQNVGGGDGRLNGSAAEEIETPPVDVNLTNKGLAGAGGGSSEDPEAPAAPLPFLVVSPLCPPGTEWAKAPMTKALFSLMDEIMANSDLPIDPLRIYLTGISMGGLGAYMLCVRQPHRWAAVAPICGGGRPLFAPLCERVPFWFFHSEEDNVIGVEETKNLAKVVPGARFTRYLHSPDPAARTWMEATTVGTGHTVGVHFGGGFLSIPVLKSSRDATKFGTSGGLVFDRISPPFSLSILIFLVEVTTSPPAAQIFFLFFILATYSGVVVLAGPPSFIITLMGLLAVEVTPLGSWEAQDGGAAAGGEGSKLLPMVLFLHGASARSTCTQLLRSCALPALLDQGLAGAGGGSSEDPEAPAAPLPFLVVSPLCPPGTEWAKAPMTKALFSLMDEIMANSDLPIDPLRIYLTGISMGGLGAYMLCVRQPHRWAAVAPICGGGRPLFAPLCERVPFWFFHSEEDNVIGVEETKNLAKVVPGARFTRYLHSPDPAARTWMVGHNCWDRTYRGCALWRWFLEHTRA
eukprot:CAMPEP_0194744558 /NCGR_PEP_ID=MMETSP0296-20130528/100935_1 /TAXON_ID=39354 /ORGANISM="Heterosigma akashiwo, Strain CCMP2393" /LENGTH=525 /DNA_ID=CAMNT_0039656717 /DNA_START=46 /DNA_END=1627 /DNA_ORIENTATION=+